MKNRNTVPRSLKDLGFVCVAVGRGVLGFVEKGVVVVFLPDEIF